MGLIFSQERGRFDAENPPIYSTIEPCVETLSVSERK